MEEPKYCVYKHTSPSGKVYIGITKQTPNCRWKNGLGYESSPHFWSAIQKYGWENFSHEILMDGISKADACAEERRLIAELNALDPAFGYNQKTGGELGSLPSAAIKEKISARRKEFYKNHPEEVQKLAERQRGKKWSEAQREKYIAAKKGVHLEISNEWREKMVESLRRRYAEDNDLRERAANRLREIGEKKSIKVVQIGADGNFIAQYQNAHDAERKTGIRNGNIGRCCKGYTKSAGGYKWQYANEYNSSSETA